MARTLDFRRQWRNVLKILRENDFNLGFYAQRVYQSRYINQAVKKIYFPRTLLQEVTG